MTVLAIARVNDLLRAVLTPSTSSVLTPPSATERTRWIGIDVDGVLADHVTHILPVLEREYGICATYEGIRTWDFPVGGTTFGAIIRARQHEKDFVLSVPPLRCAAAGVQMLFSQFRVAIVTARPPQADEWTQAWLAKHGIPYDVYANLREGRKHDTQIPCDVLVDDYLFNVLAFLRQSSGRSVLFSQPWNEERKELEPYLETGRARVARCWHDVISFIPSMAPGGGSAIV